MIRALPARLLQGVHRLKATNVTTRWLAGLTIYLAAWFAVVLVVSVLPNLLADPARAIRAAATDEVTWWPAVLVWCRVPLFAVAQIILLAILRWRIGNVGVLHGAIIGALLACVHIYLGVEWNFGQDRSTLLDLTLKNPGALLTIAFTDPIAGGMVGLLWSYFDRVSARL